MQRVALKINNATYPIKSWVSATDTPIEVTLSKTGSAYMVTDKGLYSLDPVEDTKNTYQGLCNGIPVTLLIAETRATLLYYRD